MKKELLLLVSALPCAIFAQDRPNVVVVFVDQLSPWALGCYGNTEIRTPNIDQLANDGVIFSNAYCAKAVSTPSRGCMLTGLYPFGHKATNNQMLVDSSVETYADVFNNAGYETAYMGKWHLAGHMGKNADGTPDPHWNPEINGHFKDATYMYNNGHWKNIVDVKGGVPKVSTRISGNPDEYGTDWIFQKGFEYISKHKGSPFCLVLSPPDPHPGFKVRAPYNTAVKMSELSVPLSFNENNLVNQELVKPYPYKDKKSLLKNKAQYLGMVLCLDEYMGKLEEHLKKEGIYDNTIIIFTSDHGEMMGEYRLQGKAVPYNTAYQIPLIMRIPNKGHVVVNEIYNNIDFKSTIAGLLDMKEGSRSHGRDLSSYIKDPKMPLQDEVVCLDFFNGKNDQAHVIALNQEYWFAAVFTTTKKGEITGVSRMLLFDRKKDKHQLVNLHGNKKYLEIERKMVARLRKEMQRVNHPNLKDIKWIEKALN